MKTLATIILICLSGMKAILAATLNTFSRSLEISISFTHLCIKRVNAISYFSNKSVPIEL